MERHTWRYTVVSWKLASTHRRQAAASKANRRPAAAAAPLATGGSWWKSPDRTCGSDQLNKQFNLI